jgi:hypothetical protein
VQGFWQPQALLLPLSPLLLLVVVMVAVMAAIFGDRLPLRRRLVSCRGFGRPHKSQMISKNNVLGGGMTLRRKVSAAA